MSKICEMLTVREHMESLPVELWRDDDSGRLVIKALNEGGQNATLVDLFDLVNWLKSGPHGEALDFGTIASGN